MSRQNNNAVAVERRMDLASLFCMIGRHGPAVALAVILMVSVVAGFIIYRTVRGKRRKATAAADGADSKSEEREERDASVIQEPDPEEPHRPAESTDLSDNGSSDVLKEDADLILNDIKIRQRRAGATAAAAAAAAAEKKPSLCSLPKSNVQVPLNKHTTSGDTEDMAVIQDSYKVTETYAEDAKESVQSDTYTVAEMEVEDAVDLHQCATDDGVKEEAEINDIDSRMKEPELKNDESCHEEEKKVFKAEFREDEDVTTDKDVSDKKTRQEEESFQCALSSPVCFEQMLHMSEDDDNDKLQDNKTTLETNTVESTFKEPVTHIDNLPVTCLSDDKDEDFEEEKHHLDSIDYSKYSSSNHLSTEEEKKNEVEEAEEESVNDHVISQQPEISSSTFEQETTLLPSQQDQCDHSMDVVVDEEEKKSEVEEAEEETVDYQVKSQEAEILSSTFEQETTLPSPQQDQCDQRIDVVVDKEEKKSEVEEAEEESVNYQVISQQPEIVSSTFEQETTLPSSQQHQCDHMTDVVEEEKKSEVEEVEEESVDYQVISQQAEIWSSTFEQETTLPSSQQDLWDHRMDVVADKEEKKSEVEETEDESVDYQIISQQAELWSSTSEQETTVPSSEQDQYYHSTDVAALPIQDSEAEVFEKDTDKDPTDNLTAVEFDAHSLQFKEEELQIEENGLTCNQEVGVLPAGTDQVIENILTSDNVVVCGEDSSTMALSPVLPCLSDPVKVVNLDDGLSSVTTDAKAHISSIADFPDLSLDCQQAQKEDKIVATLEDTDSANVNTQMPLHETENQPESNENGTTTVLAEECIDQVYESHVSPSCKEEQSVQLINNDSFDKADVACSDIDTNVPASLMTEEISCPHLPSIYQGCQSEHMETNETFDETVVNSVTEAAVSDNASIGVLEMSEEISHPHLLAASQDQQSSQTQNNKDFSEVTTGLAPVMTDDINPTMCQLHLLSFEQNVLSPDISSPGVGEESGISSMAVSPDLQDVGNEFETIVTNIALPVKDYDPQPEEHTEAQKCFFTEDVAVSVIKEDTAGMVFGPYPSHLPQQLQSEHTDRINYESFAANEDMFGQDIEDGYQRVMDQFVVPIASNVTSLTDELKTQPDMKAVVEVVEIKEKKEAVRAEKKEAAEADEEKDEDYEKTEISIMEATMDNNEWITDSNYQVLPWMNLSAPALVQHHTSQKTNQLPTEEGQHSPSLADVICRDTDTLPSTDVKQTSTLALVEENTEKKVVAVQPMPQNVNVIFRVHYLTQSPYQTVAVTGNQQELGNWKEFIPLERAKDGHWATVVSLPAESHVEWKFVVVDKGEVCRWEECGNRLLETGYGDDLVVHKWWGFL
ncbi:uncharacterized protein stbd1 isoform X1 [Scomber japonicus]|uniref:uncharacterized protein stbd1 isoform X1 n=1 Tax=Scomber japonicus TaxID=13676 RepID=UPI0023069846|nr:uncharacterized protein stbd1 isoform X1 [Scomber japonicus]